MKNSSMPMDGTDKKEDLPVSCGDCKHYYVTWDKDFPYGFKTMGFKSRT